MIRNNKIPRHIAYETGIAAAQYDLTHLITAFGVDNVITLTKEIASGNHDGVRAMLKKWTLHRYGDKFSMVDELCGTDTKYGLTASTARNNGAGV